MPENHLRVCLFSEQLLQPVPGGIGAYVRALLRTLPRHGVEVEPVVAWHRSAELARAGLAHARRLRLGRRPLYARWSRSGRPGVGGRADLVHAPSLAFPRRDSRPLIVTVHDLLWQQYPDAYPKRGVAFHEQSLSRIGEADLVICPSVATAGQLRALDEPPRRIRVVPQGTELAAPDPGERDRVLAELEVERPYVLWTGTLEPRKNPEGVVKGFVHAVDAGVPQGDDLNLYLAGPPGWWRGEVASFLESKGMTGRVRRIGEHSLGQREALYAGAEAFLFPSLAEGFGLPVVEAMACGAPVVTSNRSSMPEVAGSAALLCNPDDPASIGDALRKVLKAPDLAEDLRRLGFERAREFTWERTAARTVECYREVLES